MSNLLTLADSINAAYDTGKEATFLYNGTLYTFSPAGIIDWLSANPPESDIVYVRQHEPGVKVVAVGDSIIDFGDRWNASGLALEHQVDSEIMWAGLKLSALDGGPRFRYQIWQDGTNRKGANQGVAGDEPSLVYARLPAILSACDAPIIILAVGTNSESPDAQQWEAVAYLEKCVALILAAGRTCVLGCVRPRAIDGAYTEDSYLWQRRLDINTWVRAQRGRPGVVVWDMDPDMLKASPTVVGEVEAGLLVDEVHLQTKGAFRSGYKSLAGALASIIAPGTFWPALDAAANIFPNGTLAGDSGTFGTGVSGTHCNSLIAERATGSTITTVASQASGNRQVYTITSDGMASDATDVLRIRHNTTSALSTLLNTYGSDTWWQLGADVECSAWHGFGATRLWFYDSGNGINYSAGSGMSTNLPEGGADEGWRGVLHTPPLKRASWSNLRMRLDTYVYVGQHPVSGDPIAGTGVLTLRGLWLFQTDNPEVLFAL